MIRPRLVEIIGDDGRAIEEVGHWRKLYEFPSAIRDQFSDRILPFGEKMATAPPKRLDRLLAGGERPGPEFPRGIQGPIQSRSR